MSTNYLRLASVVCRHAMEHGVAIVDDGSPPLEDMIQVLREDNGYDVLTTVADVEPDYLTIAWNPARFWRAIDLTPDEAEQEVEETNGGDPIAVVHTEWDLGRILTALVRLRVLGPTITLDDFDEPDGQ